MHLDDRLWEEWDLIESTLGGDILEFERTIELNDSAIARRSYCRAIFAYAEGIAGWMKRYTIKLYSPGMLDDGEKRDLERRAGALMSLFKALDFFTSTAGATSPLVENSREWAKLESAIIIRNRITHPETATDVTISDSETKELIATRELITQIVVESLGRSGRALLCRARSLRSHLAKV